MRILFGTHQVVSLYSGGPATQILKIKEGLENLGHYVKLFSGWEDIKSEDWDIFHLFGANSNTYTLGKMVKMKGVRFVLSPIFYSKHRVFSLSLIHSLTKFLQRLTTLKKIIKTEHVICSELCSLSEIILPNTKMEMNIINKGLGIPSSKMMVVPNGVEEKFFHSKPELFEKEYGLKDFILYVGHIGTARKNLLKLIKVLNTISHPSVLIGHIIKGEYADACLSLAKKNKNLLIIPGLPNDSPLLSSAYSASSVFVLPSLFETPGIAALEAALAGAKIAITKYGGTEEYFKEHAEYIEPARESSIKNAILRSLKKEKTNSLREYIYENFLWQKIAEKTEKAYKKILRI